MTPPLAPKITAAPVLLPRGESKGVSSSSWGTRQSLRKRRSISRVVRTTSTSGSPQASFISGRSLSAFLAEQGMIETTKILWGSSPNFSAK